MRKHFTAAPRKVDGPLGSRARNRTVAEALRPVVPAEGLAPAEEAATTVATIPVDSSEAVHQLNLAG